ncbi:MAG: late competence development ComFB family protein [Dethiobacteraceae bacterium]|jgi:competence protein ComFB
MAPLVLSCRQEKWQSYGIVAKGKEKEVSEMELRNLTEKLVWQRLDEVLKEQEAEYCACEQCRLDIAALSLNQLPPRYVVTQRGETFSKADILEIQRYVDVVAAVTKAVNMVKRKPHHSKL